jgi:hypothetical protein
MARAQSLAEQMGLGALADAWRAEQHQSPEMRGLRGEHGTFGVRPLYPCGAVILDLYGH